VSQTIIVSYLHVLMVWLTLSLVLVARWIQLYRPKTHLNPKNKLLDLQVSFRVHIHPLETAVNLQKPEIL